MLKLADCVAFYNYKAYGSFWHIQLREGLSPRGSVVVSGDGRRGWTYQHFADAVIELLGR